MLEKAIAAHGILTREELTQLLDWLSVDSVGLCVMVTSPSGAELTEFDTAMIDDWPSGRVFGARGDLRWRQSVGPDDNGSAFQVLLLTESADAFSSYGSLRQTQLCVRPTQNNVMLWRPDLGTGQVPETRIGRTLSYPKSLGDIPSLRSVDYIDRDAGCVRHIRFLGAG